jgi:hypothetical protein
MNVQNMPLFGTITKHPLSRLLDYKEHAHQGMNVKKCCQCLDGVIPLKHGSLESFSNFIGFLKPYN